MIEKNWQPKLFCYIVAFSYAIFLILPLYWMIATAFKSTLDAFAYPPLLVFKPTLDNIKSVIADTEFRKSLFNSATVAILTVLFSMTFSIPASYGLSRLRGRFKSNILTWFLLTRAAPGMIYVLPYFILYNKVGLMDTIFGLVLVNMIFTIPLVTWMMLSFFEDLPESIEEAAMIDGATPFQIMMKVSVPLAMPGITSSAILAFIFSWNEFLFALILTRRSSRTAPVTIVNFMAFEGTEWGKIAAGGIFILLPVLIFSIMIRKHLIRGLTSGAVKE